MFYICLFPIQEIQQFITRFLRKHESKWKYSVPFLNQQGALNFYHHFSVKIIITFTLYIWVDNWCVSCLQRVPSSDSLSESDCSRHTTNSSLLDALSLSTSRPESLKNDQLPSYSVRGPHVPMIVQTCFKYLEAYGVLSICYHNNRMIKKNCMMIKKSINVFGFSTKFGFNKK